MLNADIIEREIIDLEKRDTTYANCERLAWLYIVRYAMQQRIVHEKARAGQMAGSPFLEACSGADITEILRVMDEHMEALRVVYPKEYEAVIRKISVTKEKQ